MPRPKTYKTRGPGKWRFRDGEPQFVAKTIQRSVSLAPRYPRYRAINSSGASYIFRRTIFQNIPINLAGGWNSLGPDLCLFPSLAALSLVVSGTTYTSPVMPSAAEFTGLFDLYRIKYVDFELIFSNNESGVSNPNNMLPVIHVMNDFDSTGAQTLTDYQQHPELRTYQLGKEYSIKHRLYPKTKGDVMTNNYLTSTSANMVRSPWLRTDAADIMHFGTRMYLNNLGRDGVVDVGTVLLKAVYTLEFKNVK